MTPFSRMKKPIVAAAALILFGSTAARAVDLAPLNPKNYPGISTKTAENISRLNELYAGLVNAAGQAKAGNCREAVNTFRNTTLGKEKFDILDPDLLKSNTLLDDLSSMIEESSENAQYIKATCPEELYMQKRTKNCDI